MNLVIRTVSSAEIRRVHMEPSTLPQVCMVVIFNGWLIHTAFKSYYLPSEEAIDYGNV